MAKSILFPSLFLTIFLILFSSLANSATLQADIQALKSFREAIDPYTIPPASFLRTWDFDLDPCESEGGQFLGIICTFSPNSSNRISVINLDSQGYDGILSPAIGNLSELTILDLSNNKLRGRIPDSVYNLQKLSRLVLNNNFFNWNVPRTISNIKTLEILDLSHNKLSGPIPKTISNIRSLTVLRLSNNGFSGRIPNLIGLWQLSDLDLSKNQLSGTLPNFPISLKTLNMNGNILTGHVPLLTQLTSLKSLELSDNRLSGTIYLEILISPSVNFLNLSRNSFSRLEISENAAKDSQLRTVDIHSNHLRGNLPVNLVNYVNLTDIDFGNNEFRGKIPVEYGQKMTGKWRKLLLDHNFLNGNLPVEFRGELVKGTKLGLAQNCLVCPKTLKLCYGGQKPASDCQA